MSVDCKIEGYQIKRVRSQKLWEKCGKEYYRDILFTDEKFFTIKELFNKQYDRMYARSSIQAWKKIPCV